MASNFLTAAGAMQGGDIHIYITIAPPAAPLVVVNPHIVGSLHVAGQRWWRLTMKVKSDFLRFMQSGWALILVPHFPLPVPPHPMQMANLLTTIATSSSAPQLTAHSVTGQGQPLCVCLIWAINLHLNCGCPSLPTGKVLNYSSVKTTPSLGDYAAAAVATVANAVYGSITGAIPFNPVSIAVTVVQTIADIADAEGNPWLPWVLDPDTQAINKAATAVQQKVDAPAGGTK